MKLKSWYIALFGILLQAGFGILLIASGKDEDVWAGLAAAILGLIVILLAVGLGIIPLVLLVSKKTRKTGAIVSIVLGVIGIGILGAGAVLGVFLVIAGVVALWKKI